MSTVSIAVNQKNPGEVLGCYGILALDFLLDKQIIRSRFVESLNMEIGRDMKPRSGVFEFEHPDFTGFLNRCRSMELTVDDKNRVGLASDGKTVLTLDWYLDLYLGDSGNFSRTDKLEFVKTHQQVLSASVAITQNHKDLFSTPVTPGGATNYLSSYNTRKKGFQDAGGVYEADEVFYASEWFLLIALQVFRHYFEKHLRTRYRLQYSTFSAWLTTNEAFVAAVAAHPSSKVFESTTRSFGKGKVLRVAQEVTN